MNRILRSARLLVPMSTALFVVACGDTDPPPTQPAAIDPAQSTVEVTPATSVLADGTSAFSVRVTVRDAAGAALDGATVSFSLTGAEASITQPGAPTGADGVAAGLVRASTPGARTLAVQATRGDSSVTLNAKPTLEFATLPASRLAFVAAPANGTAGETLAAVEVRFVDANGALVETSTAPVTLALGAAPAGATLAGTLTANAVGGVARFADLGIEKAGTGFTLVATAGAVDGATSAAFDVAAASATSLEVGALPETVRSGEALTVQVVVRDAFGNRADGYRGSLAFTSTDEAATLPATYTFTSTDAGEHSFAVTLRTAGAFGLTITDTAHAELTLSRDVTVRNGSASLLVVQGSPTEVVSSTPVEFEVVIADAAGNTVKDYTGTLQFSSDDERAVLPAATTFTATDAGRRSFTATFVTAGSRTLAIVDAAASTLAVEVPVRVFPGATDPDTSVVEVTPGTPVLADGTSVFTVRVSVRDAAGSPIEGALVTLAADGAATSITQQVGPTGADGIAEATVRASTPGARTLTIEVQRGEDVVTLSQHPTLDFKALPAARLVFEATPAGGTAGAALSAVEVRVLDANGALVEGATDVVTIALDGGPSGAVLGGTRVATPAGGVARFTDLVLEKAGEGYAFVVTSGTLDEVRSETFAVSHAAAATVTVDAPTEARSGDAFSVTVAVSDAFGNRATGYTGTVALTSNDAAATLPASHTFTAEDAGTHTFEATLATAGTKTVTLTDAAHSALTATREVTVRNGAASRLVVRNAPTEATSSVPFAIEVVLTDAAGNPALDYTGTVHFASNDTRAVLPADAAFTASDEGSRSFDVSLVTAGDHTVTITDAAEATLVATLSVKVLPGATDPDASTVEVTPATPVFADGTSAFSVRVTVRDAAGSPVQGALVTFALAGATAAITQPVGPTGADGVAVGSVRASTAGTRTLSVEVQRGAAVVELSTEKSLEFKPLPAVQLAFAAAPSGGVAGASLAAVDVRLLDANGAVVTGADDLVTIALGAGPSGAVLGGTLSVRASAGVARFSDLVIQKAGTGYAFVATAGTLEDASSATFAITPAAAASFALDAVPSTSDAGTPFTFRLLVADAFGNKATGYTGTVAVTSSDTAATLPADYTFTAGDAGEHAFAATLRSLGAQSLTLTDAARPTLTVSRNVTVESGPPSGLSVRNVPAEVTAGSSFDVEVLVSDAAGNAAADYTGTVHFTSDDARATLPADTVFTSAHAGRQTVSVTFETAGTHTLTVEDPANPSLVAQVSVRVVAAPATTFALTAPALVASGASTTVRITARDDFDNVATSYRGTVEVTSDDPTATLPENVTFSDTDAGQRDVVVVLRTAGDASITVTDVAAPELTATLELSVDSGTPRSLEIVGLVEISPAGTPVSFDVVARDVSGNVVADYAGTVAFTSDDARAVLPADYTFQPADAGEHSFTVTPKTAGEHELTVSDSSDAALVAHATLNVTPGALHGLAFISAPTTGSVRTTLADVSVELVDEFGNRVEQNEFVVLSLAGDNAEATLEGTVSGTATAGLIVFHDLSITDQGSFTLTATSGLLPPVTQLLTIVDDRAPAAPVLLAIAQLKEDGFDLTWDAVGDDDRAGRASSYDLRYATTAITNAAEFAVATPVTVGVPAESGAVESASVTGLEADTVYFFALRVIDDAGNASALATISGRTLAIADACDGYVCTPAASECAPGNVAILNHTAHCEVVGGAPTCVAGESTTTACTGLNAVCFEAACATAPTPVAGDLVITEVMTDPSAGTTEYVEILNKTNHLLNLNGLVFDVTNALMSYSETIDVGDEAAVVLAPGARYVLGQVGNEAVNGGVHVDRVYGTTITMDADASLALELGATTITELDLAGHTNVAGRARQLADLIVGTNAQGYAWYWCNASAELDGGDFGSPGAANGNCGMNVTAPVDACSIVAGTVPASVDVGATSTIAATFSEPDVTTRRADANDFYPFLDAQFGWGTGATTGWTWTAATQVTTPFASATHDELRGSLTLPSAGTWSVGFRVRLNDPATGAHGDWTYCGKTGVVDPAAGPFGQVIAAPAFTPADHVVISEVSTGSSNANDEFVELYNPTDAPVTIAGWKIQYRSNAGAGYNNSYILPAGAVIASHGYYLVGSGSYIPGGVSADTAWPGTTIQMAAGGGHIRLGLSGVGTAVSDPANTVDIVGWGTANGAEGNAPIAAPGTAGSMERRARPNSTAESMAAGGADATRGNGVDSNNNAADFVVRAVRDPQNKSSGVTENP